MNKLSAMCAYKRQFNQLLVQELKLHLPNQLISIRVEEDEDEPTIFVQFGDCDDLALFPISKDAEVFIELVTNAPVDTVTEWFKDCTSSLAYAITVAYNDFLTSLNFTTSMGSLIEMVHEMKNHIDENKLKIKCL